MHEDGRASQPCMQASKYYSPHSPQTTYTKEIRDLASTNKLKGLWDTKLCFKLASCKAASPTICLNNFYVLIMLPILRAISSTSNAPKHIQLHLSFFEVWRNIVASKGWKKTTLDGETISDGLNNAESIVSGGSLPYVSYNSRG